MANVRGRPEADSLLLINLSLLPFCPIAEALGDADISFMVGLPVAGRGYWLMTRSINLGNEARMIGVSERLLEGTGG